MGLGKFINKAVNAVIVKPVKAVAKAAEKAVNVVIVKPIQAVAKAAEKSVTWVNQEIVKPVIKTVENTVKSVLKDPLPFIAQVVGQYFMIPPYVTSAAITAMRGGDIKDIAKSAAITYIATKTIPYVAETYFADAAGTAGDFTASMADKYGITPSTAATIGNATATGVTNAAVSGMSAILAGKDVSDAITNGFVQGSVSYTSNSYFKDVQTQKDWGITPSTAKQISGLTSSTVTAFVTGNDPAKAMANYISFATLKTVDSELKKGAYYLLDQASEFAKSTIEAQKTYKSTQEKYDSTAADLKAKADAFNAEREAILAARQPYMDSYNTNLGEYNKNKAIYDDTNQSVEDRNAAVEKMNAYAAEMQKAVDGANSFNPKLETLNQKAQEIETIKQELTDPNVGIAKDLTIAANNLSSSYDQYNKITEDAKVADAEYGKQLAEVATREALVDAVNNGSLKVVDNPDAPPGSITLENGLVITADGKYLQEGKEIFSTAAGVEQSGIDFKTEAGDRFIFDNTGQRLTSETDAVKLAESEFGIKLNEKEAEKFVGVPYGTLDPLKAAAEAKVEEQLKEYGYKAPSKEMVDSFIQKGGDTLEFVEKFIDPYHVAADEVNEYYKAVLGREATPEEIELHAGAKAEADVFNERQAQEFERMRILQEVFGESSGPIYAETSKGLDVAAPRGYRVASIEDVKNKDKTGAIYDPVVNAWLVTESKPLTDKQYDFLHRSVAGGDDATALGLLDNKDIFGDYDYKTRVEVSGRFKLAGDAGIDYSKIPAGYRPATPEEAEARTATDDKGIFGDIHSNTLLIPDGSVPIELLQDYTAGYYSRSEDPSLDQIVIKDTREPSESDTDFLLRQFYGDYYKQSKSGKQSKPAKSLPTVYVNANREYEYTPWEEGLPVDGLPSLDPVTVTAKREEDPLPSLDPVTVTAKREEDPLVDLPYSPITPRPPVTNVTVPGAPAIKSPVTKSPATRRPTSEALISTMMNFPVEAAEQAEPELPVVKQSRFFDMRQPLDIGFFNQPTGTTTQEEQGVVKIASGGYMDILFPKQSMSMDEILRILEGK